MPDRPRFVIGIDLGTTNTAVAYVDLEGPRRPGGRPVRSFAVPQLVAPAEVAERPTLPSFLYLPGVHDLPEGAAALPWDAERDHVVGELARTQGAKVPGRLVASAKSWLSHAGVDRTAEILPWEAPRDVRKVSPVEASRRYLLHVREAWNDRIAAGDAAKAFERQQVVLTVPASFDEVARELTVRAAREAGIPDLVLLEEPLAAFYAWMNAHHGAQETLEDGQLVLVCDVGGGTSDFSLIGIRRDEAGALAFERLAVGEHLMLGGDNMDHLLARLIEADLAGGHGKLEAQRWPLLVHECRRAKEQLLGPDAPAQVPVVVAGTGSKLIGGTLRGDLRLEGVHQLVLDGFFPEAPLDAAPDRTMRLGLTELGLPYERDPAVTVHLAAFWRRFLPLVRQATGRERPVPDYVLFNGGVFTPQIVRQRVLDVVRQWFAADAPAGWAPQELQNDRLDLAVSRGAAHYGLVRRGEGTRVGSGSPRAYYVGIDVATAKAEGARQPAMCLVPRGAEEGFEARLDHLAFEALTNQAVTFHLFASDTRTGDALGDVVELAPEEATPLPPTRTALAFGKKGIARRLPVHLGVRLTETGTLELWCDAQQTEHRWALAFEVRDVADGGAVARTPGPDLDLDALNAAVDALDGFFGDEAATPDAAFAALERLLGQPRADWPLPVLRRLADAALTQPREASPAHEVLWFDLVGYVLRPGFGDPVDAFRLQLVWRQYMGGLHFPKHEPSRRGWWRFWRRVGGGLPPEKQLQFYYDLRPFVQIRAKRKRHPVYTWRLDQDEKRDAWQTLATFERLPAEQRAALSRTVLESLQHGDDAHETWWAMARLGAREPVYGPLDSLVPPGEVAGRLKALLDLRLPRRADVAWTLAHLARRTGDRTRDVPDYLRRDVAQRLERFADPAPYLAVLDDPDLPPEHAGWAWLLDEPLPVMTDAVLEPHGIILSDDGG